MSRPYGRPPFNPSEPVFVRRKFSANGKHWLPDEEFDWKKRALDQRKVRMLYEAGVLKQGSDAHSAAPRLVEVEQRPLPDDPAMPSLSEAAEIDDLDAIDDMAELRDIAKREGAPFKVSKVQQREAIREYRKAND